MTNNNAKDMSKKRNKIKTIIIFLCLVLIIFMKIKLNKQEEFIFNEFENEVNDLRISLRNALIMKSPQETSESSDEVAYAIGYKIGILDNLDSTGQNIRAYPNSKLDKEIGKTFNELSRYMRGFPIALEWILSDSTLDYEYEIDAFNQDLQRVHDYVLKVYLALGKDSNRMKSLKALKLSDSLDDLIRQTKSEQLKIYFDTISMHYPKYEFE